MTYEGMMAWEAGELDEAKTVELFQALIDNGMAWQLQGCYGRKAVELIRAGLCSPADKDWEHAENSLFGGYEARAAKETNPN